MNWTQKSGSKTCGALVLASVLSWGCEQGYSVRGVGSNGSVTVALPTDASVVPPSEVKTSPSPTQRVPTPVGVPPVGVVGEQGSLMTESFPAATSQIKKIDFLFVIDNSGSMADNQRKLARAFFAFANTFYRRADLDICTMIITSDRYLGRQGDYGYSREREIPCTKPAGSQNWSPAQMRAHIDELIETFQQEVYVGTYGSGVELLGKSLVSFLYNQDQYAEVTHAENRTRFFRPDAVANITFLSDENNYFFQDPNADEEDNDLPAVSGMAVPGSKSGQIDQRKGIKEVLDEYFSALNPEKELSYSTTAFLDITKSARALPGISVNLDALPALVGRESKRSDINGSAMAYTEVYQSIADALVLRATEFKLSRPVVGEAAVYIRKANGVVTRLMLGRDYRLESNQVLKLNPIVLPILSPGDWIDVTYRYDVKIAGGN
jgi:hypothetical protein